MKCFETIALAASLIAFEVWPAQAQPSAPQCIGDLSAEFAKRVGSSGKISCDTDRRECTLTEAIGPSSLGTQVVYFFEVLDLCLSRALPEFGVGAQGGFRWFRSTSEVCVLTKPAKSTTGASIEIFVKCSKRT